MVTASELVAATIWLEKGPQGDTGWCVHFQRRNHRCALAGCTCEMGEAAVWDALSCWVNFEPSPGGSKNNNETLFFREAYTHVLVDSWDYLHDLSRVPGFPQLPVSQQRAMQNFSTGFRKFASPPPLEPFVDAPARHQKRALEAEISGIHPIQEGRLPLSPRQGASQSQKHDADSNGKT
jgi:hypothetical protein